MSPTVALCLLEVQIVFFLCFAQILLEICFGKTKAHYQLTHNGFKVGPVLFPMSAYMLYVPKLQQDNNINILSINKSNYSFWLLE